MPVNKTQPALYLTFDDGPTPGITEWVLDQLDHYQAKASFFAVGEQAEKNKELLKEILKRGHTIGSHTQHHLNGWKTASSTYLRDVHAGRSALEHILFDDDEAELKFFRPPYGKIRSKDARCLEGQTIVMWDVLAADWRQDLTPAQVTANVTQKARDGSIVVFHDSLKAAPRLKEALPQILEHFHQLGYSFERLPEDATVSS